MNELTIIEQYDGHDIEFRRADGYMNFTRFCRAFGKKPSDFLRLESTKSEQALVIEEHPRLRDSLILVYLEAANGSRATWIHPELAVAAAAWVDPRFGRWCNRTVKKIIDGKAKEMSATPLLFHALESLRLSAIARSKNAADSAAQSHSHRLPRCDNGGQLRFEKWFIRQTGALRKAKGLSSSAKTRTAKACVRAVSRVPWLSW